MRLIATTVNAVDEGLRGRNVLQSVAIDCLIQPCICSSDQLTNIYVVVCTVSVQVLVNSNICVRSCVCCVHDPGIQPAESDDCASSPLCTHDTR